MTVHDPIGNEKSDGLEIEGRKHNEALTMCLNKRTASYSRMLSYEVVL